MTPFLKILYRSFSFSSHYLFFLMIGLMSPDVVFADTQQVVGIGDIAENMMATVVVVSQFLTGASFIVGITCLFAGFIRYIEHRSNPLAHPISTVIMLFLIGVALILLPFIYKYTESGVPFSPN